MKYARPFFGNMERENGEENLIDKAQMLQIHLWYEVAKIVTNLQERTQLKKEHQMQQAQQYGAEKG